MTVVLEVMSDGLFPSFEEARMRQHLGIVVNDVTLSCIPHIPCKHWKPVNSDQTLFSTIAQ